MWAARSSGGGRGRARKKTNHKRITISTEGKRLMRTKGNTASKGTRQKQKSMGEETNKINNRRPTDRPTERLRVSAFLYLAAAARIIRRGEPTRRLGPVSQSPRLRDNNHADRGSVGRFRFVRFCRPAHALLHPRLDMPPFLAHPPPCRPIPRFCAVVLSQSTPEDDTRHANPRAKPSVAVACGAVNSSPP